MQRRLPFATPPQLVILDFDGVVADSELLSNTLLAEFLSSEGLPTTVEQAMSHYMGRRWDENQQRISEHLGRTLEPLALASRQSGKTRPPRPL